jgi:hypothetical protein
MLLVGKNQGMAIKPFCSDLAAMPVLIQNFLRAPLADNPSILQPVNPVALS